MHGTLYALRDLARYPSCLSAPGRERCAHGPLDAQALRSITHGLRELARADGIADLSDRKAPLGRPRGARPFRRPRVAPYA